MGNIIKRLKRLSRKLKIHWPAGREQLRLLVAALAAVSVIALLRLRIPDAFATPQFWAEDGAEFWLDAYLNGVQAIIHPYSGNFQLAPRLVAWIGSWFDPGLAPTVYLYAAVLLTACIAAFIVLIVPNAGMGFLFAVALMLPPMPGGEIFGNPTNIHWLLAPTLALTLLTPQPSHRLARLARYFFVVLSGLSGPFSVFAMPIAVWRLYRQRDLAAVLVIAAAMAQVAAILAMPPIGSSHASLGHLITTLVVRSFGGNPWAVPFGLALLAVSCCVQTGREQRLGMIAFSGFLTLALFMKCLTLPDGLLDLPGSGPRYFYVPHVILLWCAISLLFSGPIGMITATIWIALMVMLVPKHFTRAPRADLAWREYAKKIGREDVVIPIHPPGWKISVPARRTPPNTQ